MKMTQDPAEKMVYQELLDKLVGQMNELQAVDVRELYSDFTKEKEIFKIY